MLEDPYVEAALQASPSPDYVRGPEEPEQAPPSPDYVPGLDHTDDEIVAEDQPYAKDASPTAQSPNYVLESDLEADPEEDDDEDPEEDPVDYPADGGDDGDDEDEPSEDDEDDDMDIEADDDEEEEEEHLAPTDSMVVALPAADQAPSAEETKPFETNESAATPPPHPAYRVTTRISIPALVLVPAWSDSEIPFPPQPSIPSPPLPASPPPSPICSLGYRAAMIRMKDEAASTSHSLPLPPPFILSPTRSDAPSSARVDTLEDTYFESYVKATDAVMRNMQDQNQNLQNQMTNLTDMLFKFMNSNTASTSGSGTLPSNTITNLKVDLKVITTRSGVAYQGPTIPTTSSFTPKVMERKPEVTKDMVLPTNNESTKDVQPPVVKFNLKYQILIAPVSAPMPNLKPSIPYPSRHNDERRREKANDQIEKFYKIFKDLSFEISLTDALILMPNASTLKALIGNKEKLSEMARTSLNEHCSAVILNKLPEKLGDPGKFLIPSDFPGMDECLALADLGASINLMPLSVWKKLSLPELTPTCMTLELANHSITQPIGITEDIDVKVGKFKFPANFVVVDFDADPRVPLYLGRSFLKTGHALIDVYEGELTLRVEKEPVTFNLDQTSRYSSNYDDNSVNRIDVIEIAYEEYSQEVLGFSDVITSGNPTPYYDPIVSTSSPTLTPFGDSDFLLEEVDAFLALEDDPTSSEVNESYYDPEGDILLLESFLNDDPSLPPPTQGNYLLEIRKELKVCEAKNDKSSIDEPPEVKLMDLPPHLEYAFLEGDNKFPVIIAKDLSVEQKAALIKVEVTQASHRLETL
ncbi:reverse transcriptase domain-containing protein [Tanacetum coccineum]